jgi:hypothetical protein
VNSEFLLWLSLVLGAIIIGLVILLLMEREKRRPLTKEPLKAGEGKSLVGLPFSMKRTVTTGVFDETRDKLRLLDLEREILSYAIRRLYEASAEGKISEAERDRLALKYKMDLARIKEEIGRGESIVALNELEKMQEEFINLFQERFEQIGKRIDELRTTSGLAVQELEATPKVGAEEEPEEIEEEETAEEELEEEAEEEAGEEDKLQKTEEPAEKPAEVKAKRKTAKPKPPPEPEQDSAEKKVEQIVAEVEKVLKKLGQMEVEE